MNWEQIFYEWFLSELLASLEGSAGASPEADTTVAPRASGQYSRHQGRTRFTARQSNLAPRPGQGFPVFSVGGADRAGGDGTRSPAPFLPAEDEAFPLGREWLAHSLYYAKFNGSARKDMPAQTAGPGEIVTEGASLVLRRIQAQRGRSMWWYGAESGTTSMYFWKTLPLGASKTGRVIVGPIAPYNRTDAATGVVTTPNAWPISFHDEDPIYRGLAGGVGNIDVENTDLEELGYSSYTSSTQHFQHWGLLQSLPSGRVMSVDHAFLPGDVASALTEAAYSALLTSDFGSSHAWKTRYLITGTPRVNGQRNFFPSPIGGGAKLTDYDGVSGVTKMWVHDRISEIITRNPGGILVTYDPGNAVWYLSLDVFFRNSHVDLLTEAPFTYEEWLTWAYGIADSPSYSGVIIDDGTNKTWRDYLDGFDHASYRTASGVDSDPYNQIDPLPYTLSTEAMGGWHLTRGFLPDPVDVGGNPIGNKPVRVIAKVTNAGTVSAHLIDAKTFSVFDGTRSTQHEWAPSEYVSRDVLPNSQKRVVDVTGGVARVICARTYDEAWSGNFAEALSALFVMTYDLNTHTVLSVHDLLPDIGYASPSYPMDTIDVVPLLFPRNETSRGQILLTTTNVAEDRVKIISFTVKNADSTDATGISAAWDPRRRLGVDWATTDDSIPIIYSR